MINKGELVFENQPLRLTWAHPMTSCDLSGAAAITEINRNSEEGTATKTNSKIHCST